MVGPVWVGSTGWASRGCSVIRTYEVGVKPFGSTVKKEVRMEVESREKLWDM